MQIYLIEMRDHDADYETWNICPDIYGAYLSEESAQRVVDAAKAHRATQEATYRRMLGERDALVRLQRQELDDAGFPNAIQVVPDVLHSRIVNQPDLRVSDPIEVNDERSTQPHPATDRPA